jgi:O-antigen/teichoic acid export membrane protein
MTEQAQPSGPADSAARRVRELITRYRAILGQGIFVGAGQGVTGILTLAGTRLITQFVNPELYGAVNLLQNSLVLLRTLFCSPMLNAALRFYPDAERGEYISGFRAYLLRSLKHSVTAMEILVVGGAIFWCWLKGMPLGIVVGLAIFVAADVSRTFEMSLLNAARRQFPAAILSIFEAFVRPVLIVAAVWVLGARIEAVIGALALSVVVTLFLLFAAFERVGSRDRGILPDSIGPEMRSYAFPLIPIALMNWITAVSDRYIIEWISHDTYSVGIYAAGYGLVSQPFLLMHAVVALTLRPAYFAAVAGASHRRARHLFNVWLLISGSVCLLAAAAFFGARTFVVDMFLGHQYQGAKDFVPWIALGYLFYVVEQVLEQQLLAYKRTAAVLMTQTGGAFCSVAVTVPCVAKFGAIGAAYACPIYFAIQCLIVVALSRHQNHAHAIDGPRAGP